MNEAEFAVLYLDLNNFKAYNDKYGFERGDNLFRKFCRPFPKKTGKEDIFRSRTGSELLGDS